MTKYTENGRTPLAKRLLVGEFQFEVMRAVNTLGKNAYGTRVRDYLEDRIDREIDMPQVYTALSRLCDLGLMSSEVDKTASAGRRGRPRRFYHLETPGLQMLQTNADLYDSPASDGRRQNAAIGAEATHSPE